MERGNFEIIVPPAEIRPFVRRYLYANRALQDGLTIHAKPTGYSYLSSFFGRHSPDYGIIDGRRFERKTRWFLFGRMVDHQVTFHHAESLELLVCELTATAHQRLFGISGERIVGMASAFDEAAPHRLELARACFKLDANASRDDHVAEGNSFFSRLSESALPGDPAVERAVALIEAADGAIRISDICREIGIGERQLNRKFKSIVGLSPKYFARILQINWVVGLLYAEDKSTLTEIAHEAGFYDQAHFNRSVQHFLREGPRDFLRSDHPALRSFLAGSRRFGPNALRTGAAARSRPNARRC